MNRVGDGLFIVGTYTMIVVVILIVAAVLDKYLEKGIKQYEKDRREGKI